MTQPTHAQVLAVCDRFAFAATVVDVKTCGNGHINSTYIITVDGAKRYILQILNTAIFTNPVRVMDNIVAVTNHIRTGLVKNGEDATRGTMQVIFTKDGQNGYTDSEGRFWRAYDFVEETVCRLTVDSADTFQNVGYAFGDFSRRLSNFDASCLYESIPNFHHTPKRFAHFEEAYRTDPVKRLASAQAEADALMERGNNCHTITDALEAGNIPLRVTHNDTKLSNILLDAHTGESVCIIDLDTVMPGSALYDFGDAIRAGASTAAEDEPDLEKVHFDAAMFRAFAEGFAHGMGGALTDKEKRLLPIGAWTIIYEQAVRFLDDYLRGDTYYHVDYPSHNLVRARTQLKLLLELEEQMTTLDAFVEKL